MKTNLKITSLPPCEGPQSHPPVKGGKGGSPPFVREVSRRDGGLTKFLPFCKS